MNEGQLPPLFYTLRFVLFHGWGGGDGFRLQGYPAPPSLVILV